MFLLNWCKNLRAHFGMYRKRAGVWTPGSPLRCAPALEEIQQSLWFFSSSKVSIWTSSYGRVCQFCLFSSQNAGFLDHQNLSIKPLISLRENCPDTEFFLVGIFPYSDSKSSYSIQIRTGKNSTRLRSKTQTFSY